MGWSSNATASTLRPKNMRELYGNETVYVLAHVGARNHLAHMVFDVADWAEAEHKFGQTIAEFRSHEKRWYLIGQDAVPFPATHAEIQKAILGTYSVCMLGKGCQKHG